MVLSEKNYAKNVLRKLYIRKEFFGIFLETLFFARVGPRVYQLRVESTHVELELTREIYVQNTLSLLSWQYQSYATKINIARNSIARIGIENLQKISTKSFGPI